jgi:hypothetical protein
MLNGGTAIRVLADQGAGSVESKVTAAAFDDGPDGHMSVGDGDEPGVLG